MGTHLAKWGRKAALGLAGIGLLGFMTCVQYVPPRNNAVRQTKISVPGLTGPVGYSTEVAQGGRWHLVIPALEQLHEFPHQIQVLDFNRYHKVIDSEYVRAVPAARIETPDTFHVDLDVSVGYRIVDPGKTINEAGTGKLYQASVIDKYVESGLKRVLGKLQPEHFFEVDATTNKPMRIAAQKEAKAQLTEVMKPYGIEVNYVLIRFPEYVEQVQTRFEQKSVEDQRTLTNTAQASLEEKRVTYNSLNEQGLQAAKKRRAEGDAYKAEIAGRITAYKADKESAGDRLVEIARAEATRLENDAYQGKGAELLVGLEMAKNLCNMDRILVSSCGDNSFNPLDLEATTRTITGSNR